MATVSQLPASCNLVCTVGNDFTLTLAVTENGSTWSSTGATLATDIIARDGTVVATDFTTAATDGQVTLTLTDANTTALGVGVYSYRLSVTKSGNTRDWIAGTLSVVEAGIGGTTSSAASLSITTGAVSLSTTTLVAPAAANISVADVANLLIADDAEAALEEVARTPYQGAGLLCITVDDGNSDMVTIAAALEERGQRGTFGITSDYINSANKITSANLLALSQAGHEIAAHSKTHTNMLSLTATQRATEWDTPKSVIEGIIGAGKVTTWVYPYGSQGSGRSNTTDKEAYTRYSRICDTAVQTIPCLYPRNQTPPSLIQRTNWNDVNQAMILNMVRRLAVEASVGVVYFHQLDAAVNPTTADFEAVLDLAQSLGVRCVTISQAFGSFELLGNPSFEDSASSVYPWYEITSNGGTVAIADAITPDSGLSGTRALQLTVPAGSASAYVRQIVPVTPGVTYTLTYRAKVISGTIAQANDCYGRIVGLDYTQTTLGDDTVTPAPTLTTWQSKTIDYLAPASARYVRVECVLVDVATGATVQFDHVWFGPKNHGDLG